MATYTTSRSVYINPLLTFLGTDSKLLVYSVDNTRLHTKKTQSVRAFSYLISICVTMWVFRYYILLSSYFDEREKYIFSFLFGLSALCVSIFIIFSFVNEFDRVRRKDLGQIVIYGRQHISLQLPSVGFCLVLFSFFSAIWYGPVVFAPVARFSAALCALALILLSVDFARACFRDLSLKNRLT